MFRGSPRSWQGHGFPHEVRSSEESSRRFPGYRLPQELLALRQPEGGFLVSERSVVAHVVAARRAGAEIRARQRVIGWALAWEGVRATTERGAFRARRLIVCAGTWVGELVPDLATLARAERQVLA